MPQEKTRRTRRTREETRDILIETARDILREEGVLGGLNLRDVAVRAGVNHGQIYEYFGDRRTLLREAVQKDMRRELVETTADKYWELPFAQRRVARFERALNAARNHGVDLTALLALDGDESTPIMPFFDRAMDSIDNDIKAGAFSDTVDPVAAHVLTFCAVRGYALYREALSRDTGVDIDALDERVLALFRTAVEQMAVGQGGTAEADSTKG